MREQAEKKARTRSRDERVEIREVCGVAVLAAKSRRSEEVPGSAEQRFVVQACLPWVLDFAVSARPQTKKKLLTLKPSQR
jgi:hypothetical protein